MPQPERPETVCSADVAAVPVDAVLGLLAAASGEHPEATADPAALLAGHDLPAAAVDRIDAQVRLMRRTGDHWRRRGQELAALFSSARELAQLRDVDVLLERLVERAHDLVGTDVTYLSEFHAETRELRVRTTLGTTTPAFRTLRVPPGKGLASSVVDSRAPQWTHRYADFAPDQHDPAIDSAVSGEGLVSLLGVPLLAGDDVIGVLFAADRVERSFTPEEIALLSAFADHAAVVLQTARLLGATRSAHEDAERACAALAGHVEAMERASTVHEELTGIVLRGGTAAEVIAALGQALRCTAAVLDDELRRLPGSDRSPDADVPSPVRVAAEDSHRSGHCVVLPGPDGADRAVVAVVAGSTFLGALLLDAGTVPFGPVERRIAERAAQITALLTLKQDAMIDAEQRVRGDLLADLLADDRNRLHDLAVRAHARHVDLGDLRTVVVAATAPEHRRTAVAAAGRTVGSRGLAGEFAGRIVVLTATEAPGAAARAVHHAVRRALHMPVLCVGARLVDGSTGIRAQFTEAEGILRILPALGLHDAAVSADEYLPYAALFGPDGDRIDAFVDATVGPLVRWDHARGSHLVPTLAAYLDHRLSPIGTARVLHLHKNTVLQRLERIAELLGPDWQSPDRQFRVAVAVRICTLRTRTTQG